MRVAAQPKRRKKTRPVQAAGLFGQNSWRHLKASGVFTTCRSVLSLAEGSAWPKQGN